LDSIHIVDSFTTELRVVFAQNAIEDWTVTNLKLYISDGSSKGIELLDFSGRGNDGKIRGLPSGFSFARPDSTISGATDWTVTGAPTHHEATDDVVVDYDVTYVETTTNTAPLTLGLSNLTDPLTNVKHTMRITVSAADSAADTDVKFDLYQGSTFIATTGFQTAPRFNLYITFQYTLTAAEADAITNYSDLRAVITGSNIGAGDKLRVTHVEFSVPTYPPVEAGVAGQFGFARNFDGVDDMVDTGLDLPTGPFSLSVWLYADDLASADSFKGIVAKRLPKNEWRFGVTATGSLSFVAWEDDATVTISATSTASIATGAWYHVGMTWTGTDVSFYLNGSFVDTVSRTGNPVQDISATVKLGTDSDDPDRFWDGRFDEVLVFSRALSDDEMEALGQEYPVSITLDTPTGPGPGATLVESIAPTVVTVAGFAALGLGMFVLATDTLRRLRGE
jgi:hypothetical protein